MGSTWSSSDRLVDDERTLAVDRPATGRRAASGSYRRRAVAVVVVGLVLTWVATALVVGHQEEHHRAELDALALDASGLLASRLSVIEQTLWALGAELKVDGTDTDEFRSIVAGGRLTERAPGVDSLSFARESPAPGPDRAASGGERLVVERIVPAELEAGVVGALDLYVEQERRRATTTARDFGIATATAPRELAYGGVGVLFYTPVYANEPVSVAERRAGLLGVTIAVIDIEALFDDVLGPSPLVDATVADLGPRNVVATGQAAEVWSTDGQEGGAPPSLSSSVELAVGDRAWRLDLRPTDLMEVSETAGYVTATAGLLLTALLAALVVAVLGARDRAERLAAERTTELRDAYDQLLVVDRLRRHFVTTVSHELRTPLTAVLGFVQTLRRLPDDDPRAEEMLVRAERQALQLSRMIEELLDFGRLERGELLVEPMPHDLRTLVPQIVEDLRPVWEPMRVSVSVDRRDAAFADVDPAALARVLGNLLSNAVRYAPGSEVVEVSVACTGDDVVVSVADRGPGLVPEDAAHVFERFFRGQGQMGAGTGIGLAVVEGLVRAHGGSARLANRPRGGAVATVRLPRVPVAHVDVDGPDGSDAATAVRDSVTHARRAITEAR